MAFFIPPTHAIVHKELNLLYQFWIHTEVVRYIGPLEYILNTASHHRVHHGMIYYYMLTIRCTVCSTFLTIIHYHLQELIATA